MTEAPPGALQAAEHLVTAFYAELASDGASLTGALRRRELAIAQQLIAAGATPAEAAAYARDCSATSGRIAPIDLRSFERERLGWSARRRHAQVTSQQVIDRTGQPPSWQQAMLDPAGAPAEQAPGREEIREPASRSEPTRRGPGGSELRDALTTLLLTSRS